MEDAEQAAKQALEINKQDAAKALQERREAHAKRHIREGRQGDSCCRQGRESEEEVIDYMGMD